MALFQINNDLTIKILVVIYNIKGGIDLMKHIVDLYPGIYEIETTEDGIKYWAYQNPSKKPPIQWTFATSADSRGFILDIIKLDLTD